MTLDVKNTFNSARWKQSKVGWVRLGSVVVTYCLEILYPKAYRSEIYLIICLLTAWLTVSLNTLNTGTHQQQTQIK